MPKTQSLAKTQQQEVAIVSQEDKDFLGSLFVQESSYQKVSFPRISFVSQDKTETIGTGKNKEIKLITAAGIFFTEKATDEKDENGKSIWDKEEIGDTIEVQIVYERRQLRYYDDAEKKFTSSPIYDSAEEIVPLFCERKEVLRGTPKELQSHFMTKVIRSGKRKGQKTTALEEERILYVIYQGEVYSMNIKGSSLWGHDPIGFLEYKKRCNPAMVITSISSVEKQPGEEVCWNQLSFTALRPANSEEFETVKNTAMMLLNSIKEEKAFFSKENVQSEEDQLAQEEADREFGSFGKK